MKLDQINNESIVGIRSNKKYAIVFNKEKQEYEGMSLEEIIGSPYPSKWSKPSVIEYIIKWKNFDYDSKFYIFKTHEDLIKWLKDENR